MLPQHDGEVPGVRVELVVAGEEAVGVGVLWREGGNGEGGRER